MNYFYHLIVLSFIINLKLKGLRRLLHWGPLIALFIIYSITTSAIFTHYELFPPNKWASFLNMAALIGWLNAILFNFYRASANGPGFVPAAWKPKDPSDSIFLQFCSECLSYKCPRSHHCRKCRRCVMKMDHHCPWINTCVGHVNHHHFTLFLLLVPPACIHALFSIVPCLHYYLFDSAKLINVISVRLVILNFVAAGMALGVTLAMTVLFVIQMRSIVRNETGIESWIKEKAEYGREIGLRQDAFVYPYNLGRWSNVKEVFWGNGDGVVWPIRDECHQYTLTVEQIQQKNNKRSQSVLFSVLKAYQGTIFPIFHGFRVFCDIPCFDEYRLRVVEGDHVVVTRYKKHWLYGEKLGLTPNGSFTYKEKSEKGWFPRNCATKIDDVLPVPLHKLPLWHLSHEVDVDKLHEVANRTFLFPSKKKE